MCALPAARLQAARLVGLSDPTIATAPSRATWEQTRSAVAALLASSTITRSSWRPPPARLWALMSATATVAPWTAGSAPAVPEPVSETMRPTFRYPVLAVGVGTVELQLATTRGMTIKRQMNRTAAPRRRPSGGAGIGESILFYLPDGPVAARGPDEQR